MAVPMDFFFFISLPIFPPICPSFRLFCYPYQLPQNYFRFFFLSASPSFSLPLFRLHLDSPCVFGRSASLLLSFFSSPYLPLFFPPDHFWTSAKFGFFLSSSFIYILPQPTLPHCSDTLSVLSPQNLCRILEFYLRMSGHPRGMMETLWANKALSLPLAVFVLSFYIRLQAVLLGYC